MAKERTLVLLKPDAVKRDLIGEIITVFEHADLKVVEMKMTQASEDLLDKHYVSTDEWLEGVGNKNLVAYKELGLSCKEVLGTDKPKEIGIIVKKWIIHYMSSYKLVAMVIEGNNAIANVRRIVGPTIPANADPGTIRGKYSCDSPDTANKEKRCVNNLVHASGNAEEAKYEINLWFPNSK